MSIRIVITLLLVIVLSACAPKYNYRNADYQSQQIDHLLVVIDYTHFVDDVGKMFDYDTLENQHRVAELQAALEKIFIEKGYKNRVDFALVSSGVGFNPDMAFEHYEGSELLEELIYPPFFINSSYPAGVQDELLRSFVDSQRIAITTVSKDTQNYLKRVRITPINLFVVGSDDGMEDMDSPWTSDDSVAVLHIRALAPRVSFVKAMGVSVISAGVTLGATSGAFIGMAVPMGRSHSTALIFDNQSGEVVWKNFKLGDLSRFSDNVLGQFFKDFPVKP